MQHIVSTVYICLILYFQIAVSVYLGYELGYLGSFPRTKISTHPHLIPKQRLVEIYCHSMYLHGMLLN
jgi:hypothetical protein